jgi:hypothetical protein
MQTLLRDHSKKKRPSRKEKGVGPAMLSLGVYAGNCYLRIAVCQETRDAKDRAPAASIIEVHTPEFLEKFARWRKTNGLSPTWMDSISTSA